MSKAYSSRCRVGNWYEDVAAEEEAMQKFLEAKNKGELTLHKSQALQSANSTQVKLSTSQGHLEFGFHVLLRNPATEGALAAVHSLGADPTHIDVNATPKATPTRRNTFTIVPFTGGDEEPKPDNANVSFGDKFHLRTEAPQGQELFLCSEKKTIFGGASKRSGQQTVFLIPSNEGEGAYNTVWEFVPLKPETRLELDETPVPANTPVLVRHSRTGMCLAALHDVPVATEFGLEKEVTCHTHMTTHKIEGPQNVWVVETE
eukprot:m.21248 g.21248  ORF g.21248 m.21248 type:complete len:260 (+) comp12655_c0_seq2:48-827(+)